MLINVAPVMPDAALAAIERALLGANEATLKKSLYVVDLLRSLAYEAAQFERAVSLLIKFAQVADTDDVHEKKVAGIVASLFHIILSGTHAPVGMRLKVVEPLLKSDDAGSRNLGVKLLEAMLKTDHFSSSYGFDFGARSRDYGYEPRTRKDVRAWFDAVFKVASPLASSDSAVAAQVRKSVADEFRGLWMNAGQADALEKLARQIAEKGFWREGWVAARQTRIFDGKQMPADILARLTALEEWLRPKNLVDQVRGVVLGAGGDSIDLDYDIDDTETDDFASAAARMDTTIENLGRDVGTDADAFKTLLPSLVRGSSRVPLFGEGLASTAEKPYEIWSAIVTELAATHNADTRVLRGFIRGLQKRDAALAGELLDEAVEHPVLGAHFPELQVSVPIDERGVQRLRRALDLGKASITTKQCRVMPGSELPSTQKARYKELGKYATVDEAKAAMDSMLGGACPKL